MDLQQTYEMDNNRATNIKLPPPKSMNEKIYDNVQDTN